MNEITAAVNYHYQNQLRVIETARDMHTISKVRLLLHSLQLQFKFLVLRCQATSVSLHFIT